ncbi:carboxymuconolactone decarboxylase family protein [Microbulbifer rhizosphaerae]|uniref:Putative peroxidase-related enzyme n=1 Tax=Microbulbifer rhizosphaerae TaxID=1562603 RepID=A0A7W4Z956_9GAMM|nr:carboxymuconolactone decarboxylase family protein [Microbulbifer rhizosphaerae]MBB3059909.1 putative peroxidase-related enzyme [Microbulbifer rhizosphaerae]
MTDFTFHTPESAPEDARDVLEKAQAQMGFVPGLYAGLANAPAALDAYLAVSDYFSRTSLSPEEQQVVLLAASVVNGCDFCVAAHSMIAKQMAGVAEPVVAALRDGGQPQDPKLAALAEFTRAVVSERGWVREHPAFRAFLDAGYRPEQALEVILGVAQKTLSNYANHLLQTPLDSALESERWSR